MDMHSVIIATLSIISGILIGIIGAGKEIEKLEKENAELKQENDSVKYRNEVLGAMVKRETRR